MRRPLAIFPRGPRRSRSKLPDRLLLACPRVSPEWEFAAIRALMKPQTKGRILHRHSNQPLPKDAARRVELAREEMIKRIAYAPCPQFPAAGDFHFIVEVKPGESNQSRAFALLLSRTFPGTWLLIDRLFVRDGKFYRRARRIPLQLLPARDIHLPREMRSALRDIL